MRRIVVVLVLTVVLVVLLFLYPTSRNISLSAPRSPQTSHHAGHAARTVGMTTASAA